MARVNVGVNPKYLADQHLIAESVEITMITGQLQQHNFKIKSEIPTYFPMGKGHMTFFKDKLFYLARRLEHVNNEMRRRGFTPGTSLNEFIDTCPRPELVNDWKPSTWDSKQIRDRISSRLFVRLKGKPGLGYYRYEREYITDMNEFVNNLQKSELYIL